MAEHIMFSKAHRRLQRKVRKNAPDVKDLHLYTVNGEHIPFSEALRGNTNVKRISIDHGQVASAPWKPFCKTLGHLQSLECLKLSRVYIQENHAGGHRFDATVEQAFAERLSYLLRKTRQIKTLTIDDEHFSYFFADQEICQWDAARMTLLARELMGHASLEDFTFHNFAYDSTETLDILVYALCTVPKLSRVDLCPSEHDEGEGDALAFSPHFLRLLLQLSSLVELHLGNMGFTHFHLNVFAHNLAGNDSHLVDLHLENCDIDAGTNFLEAVGGNKSLRTLSLRRVNLDNVSEAFGQALQFNTGLEVLKLEHCFSWSGEYDWARQIFSALQVNTTLRELCLSGINEDDDLLTDEIFGVLCQALLTNSSLQCLSLVHCQLKDVHSANWIASVLRNNVTLKGLNLSFNEFTDIGLKTILPALQENAMLEDFQIGPNRERVSDEMNISFVAGLPNATNVKRLSLSYYQINSQHSDSLVKAVRQNYGLEYLDLRSADSEVNSIINTILELNKAGRRYLLEDGAPRAKGVEVLITVKENLDYLFFHLLENPGLCDIRKPNGNSPRKRKRKRKFRLLNII